MKFKRGQVALEFLTTYGWAILVLLVAIGVLGQFGVLSPDRLLPDNCDMGVNFRCHDHRASFSENSLNLALSYEGDGVLTTISNIEIVSQEGLVDLTDVGCEVTDDDAINIGDETDADFTAIYDRFYFDCDVGPQSEWNLPNSKQRFTVNFNYELQGGDFVRSNTGQVVATVVE